MRDLIWDESLSVQLEEIDDDHQKLIDLFNLINHAMTDGDAPEYIEALVDEMISFTAWHFKHEERLMLKYAYPGLDEHRNEHYDLIQSAVELKNALAEGEGFALSAENLEFLEHWLTGHILGADMELGAFLGENM